MAEPDSWEDVAGQPGGAAPSGAQPTGLNVNAASFSFNPTAVTFTPNFGGYAAPAPGFYAPPYGAPGQQYGMNQYVPQPGYQQPQQGYQQPQQGYQQAFQQPPQPQYHQYQDPAIVGSGPVSYQPPAEAVVKVLGAPVAKPEPKKVEPTVESASTKLSALSVEQQPPSTEALKVAPPAPAPAAAAAKSSKEEVPAPSPAAAPKEETPAVVAPVEVDEVIEIPEDDDKREHLNIVFIGHVDAGKSTIGGQILYLANMVDERTIQKYEREAKAQNRESWYMAYIMDTNEEERAKGKTVEVGRAHFETEKKRYTILDAPGHKNYVPNMISGASQADIGVLVIAARKGEFETGFERGGQTREHAQLAKTLGVSKLVVVVNKMDDPSVKWAKERFDDIVTKMIPFLKGCGYNVKRDVQFLPISGLYGSNMRDPVSKDVCPWWSGPTLFSTLDALETPPRDPKGPFRLPIIDKYRDMGTVVMGKIESGCVKRGDSLLVMPNKVPVKVVTIFRDNDEVAYARPGENLRIRLTGVEEEEVSAGFVVSSVRRPIAAVTEFDAQLQVLELLEHKSIFTAGYKAVLHIHSVVEECEIMQLLQQIDPKTKKAMKKKPLFVKSNAVVTVRVQFAQSICVEKFADFPQLGRFTLRDEGKTVAIGKVLTLINPSTFAAPAATLSAPSAPASE